MKKEIIIQTNSVADTEKLASSIAKLIYPGLVIALNGDLGAGKTTFVRALIQHCCPGEIVNSPTFTLLNIHGSKLKFYHFDLYRLASLEDIENIGGEELIPSRDGVTLIEWADRIPEILPEEYLQINIFYQDQNVRKFRIINKTLKINFKKIIL